MVQREPSESIEYYVVLSPPRRLVAPRADHDDKRTAERRNITDVNNVEEEFSPSNKFQENHLLPVLGTPTSDLSSGSIRQKIDKKEEQRAITSTIGDRLHPPMADKRRLYTQQLEIGGLSITAEQQKQCFPGGQLDEISYAVIQKIRSGIIRNQKMLASIPPNVTRPKILCMVYTHEGAHETKLKAIVDTWANDCDGFFAASNVTDASLGAIKLSFHGPESYTNMWRKVQAMWIHAYHHYVNDYDYFHICGDDVYVVADNLRMFLMTEQVHKLSNDGYMDTFSVMSKRKKKWSKARPRPLFFGYPLHLDLRKNGEHQYAAGGSGYTLNREAVRVFYNLITNFPDNRTDSREDILMARWLELDGITVSDTRDATGAFRYIPNNPIIEYPCLHKWPFRNLDSQVKCIKGLEGFSNETVAVHLNYDKVED
jgi:Fringe-like.